MTESQFPKSRLPRTGTLVLIAVVLLVGGGAFMVWLPYHKNQVAVAEVERLGGEAYSTIVRPVWIPYAVDNEYLAVFERVTEVNLANTQVGDAGLGHIQGLTNLEDLWLDNTEISDAGLEHLRGLTNLWQLLLDNTQISDAGLKHLQRLSTLEVLSLTNTQVSDAGLEHLRRLTNLFHLGLDNTQVTKAEIEKLKKALPNCYIEWTPPAE